MVSRGVRVKERVEEVGVEMGLVVKKEGEESRKMRKNMTTRRWRNKRWRKNTRWRHWKDKTRRRRRKNMTNKRKSPHKRHKTTMR